MSTLESKLEAWLKYVAKQEESIKQGEQPDGEPQQTAQPAQPMAQTPAPPTYAPASTPALAQSPATTATISRRPSANLTPEPEIPEVEDFLPILRRRVAPPPIPETPSRPVVEGQPQIIVRPMPPRADAPAPPTAQAIPVVTPPAERIRPMPPRQDEPSLFMPPSPPAYPAAPPAPAPAAPEVKAAPAPVAPEVKVVAAPVPAAPVVKPVVRAQPAPTAQMAPEETQEMWDRLPKHVQLLVGMQPAEIAQKSYKQFKETREQLIERLLDPTLSLEETARVLNVCPTTVRRYTNRGALQHLRTAGNQRRFKLSDVLMFMETLGGKSTVS